jgi:DNA replication and repair protein RecF
MIFLQRLSLFQFKNYGRRSFEFPARITGIHGRNGAGKTNLLDAIYYLCFTRSYFTRSEQYNVQQGQSGFRIEGTFLLLDQPEEAVCILRENGRKEFSINGQPYERFSQHIGRYPCVVIAPDDSVLITGGSEERRKFIDSILCQLDPAYLQHLIRYQKILQQRNSLLKGFAETGTKNEELLTVLDDQLAEQGQPVFEKRKEFMLAFLPRVKSEYLEIAMQPEPLNLFYESELMNSTMLELLRAQRSRDYMLCRTQSGIHRDDLVIQLGEQEFKSIASQGQRKSLLFALKIAELKVLEEEKKFPPLLLLDDVFEKLDEDRILNLLKKVCLENQGQVFITDTSEERLREKLTQLDTEFHMTGISIPG